MRLTTHLHIMPWLIVNYTFTCCRVTGSGWGFNAIAFKYISCRAEGCLGLRFPSCIYFVMQKLLPLTVWSTILLERYIQ